MSTPLDLSTLPAPAVVETLSYEAVLAAMLADLQARDPSFTAIVESDPAMKILEVCALRETILRARINDAAKATMLAYAAGSDLDQLAALVNVQRKVITPANPETVPPTAAVLEDDTALRYRTQLAFEGISTAGPAGSYEFHALRVATIKDVAVAGPPTVDPGNVRVTLLSVNDEASPAEIAAVEAILSDEDVRPLTDLVTVQSATIVGYTVEAVLHVTPGWDSALAISTATSALVAYCAGAYRIGHNIPISGIYKSLHVAGVDSVTLVTSGGGIGADLVVSDVEAAKLTSHTITAA